MNSRLPKEQEKELERLCEKHGLDYYCPVSTDRAMEALREGTQAIVALRFDGRDMGMGDAMRSRPCISTIASDGSRPRIRERYRFQA